MDTAVGAHRFQFAFTITYHYLFPILTMGLAVFVAWLKTVSYLGRDEPSLPALAQVRRRAGGVRDVRPSEPLSMIPLRGVFAPGDAWLMTGDLFRRDEDGELWRVDNLAEVVRTVDGPVFTGPIRDALGDIPAVDLVVEL